MKRILWTTISLLLGSCGVTRQSTVATSESRSETVAERSMAAAADCTALVRRIAESELDGELTVETEEFDASLPADTLTGLPPLRRRTTQRLLFAARQHETAVAESRAAATLAVAEETTLTAGHAAAVTATRRRGPGVWQRALCAAGTLVVAGTAGWLVSRRLRRTDR